MTGAGTEKIRKYVTRTTVSVLAMVVLAVGSFYYMTRLGLRVEALSDVKTARMELADTNGLVLGSRVLLRGVQVGHITSIQSSPDGVRVEWAFDRDTKIPRDSIYRVDNLSALGEPYIGILPNTSAGPYVEDGQTIDADRVKVPTTFNELSQYLTDFLEQVDTDDVRDIFEVMDVALPDESGVLTNLSYAGRLLASAVVREQSSLNTVLTTFQPILMNSAGIPEDLRDTSPTLELFGRKTNRTLDFINFVTTFSGGPESVTGGVAPFIAELQKFLDSNAADLKTIGVNLLPAATASSAAIRTLNIGQVLDQALAGAPDGAIEIRLRVSTNTGG